MSSLAPATVAPAWSPSILTQVVDELRRDLTIPPEQLHDWIQAHLAQLHTLVTVNSPSELGRANSAWLSPLQTYDAVVIAFSGGKDSLAAVLHVLDLLSWDRSRVELWHHLVDGEREEALWDWPVTSSYCEAVARALGLPLYFSWRDGGFEAEMLRNNQPTGAMVTELPDGGRAYSGGDGPPGTRRRFPQLSADLSTRYCSSYLKIDVGAAAIRTRWPVGKVLMVTGERREESSNRRAYARVEQHRSHTQKRRVDQWRPVLDWDESQVWSRIQRAGILPHPAYYAGYSRLSCACCIFGGADEWATFRAVRPQQWTYLAELEGTFDRTLKRDITIPELTERGQPFPQVRNPLLRDLLNSPTYTAPITVDPAQWPLPPGAFRKGGGPV